MKSVIIVEKHESDGSHVVGVATTLDKARQMMLRAIFGYTPELIHIPPEKEEFTSENWRVVNAFALIPMIELCECWELEFSGGISLFSINVDEVKG